MIRIPGKSYGKKVNAFLIKKLCTGENPLVRHAITPLAPVPVPGGFVSPREGCYGASSIMSGSVMMAKT